MASWSVLFKKAASLEQIGFDTANEMINAKVPVKADFFSGSSGSGYSKKGGGGGDRKRKNAANEKQSSNDNSTVNEEIVDDEPEYDYSGSLGSFVSSASASASAPASVKEKRNVVSEVPVICKDQKVKKEKKKEKEKKRKRDRDNDDGVIDSPSLESLEEHADADDIVTATDDKNERKRLKKERKQKESAVDSVEVDKVGVGIEQAEVSVSVTVVNVNVVDKEERKRLKKERKQEAYDLKIATADKVDSGVKKAKVKATKVEKVTVPFALTKERNEVLPLPSTQILQIVTDFPYPVDPDDHCESPLEAYQDAAALIGQFGTSSDSLMIYDPYYCDGLVIKNLSSLGFPHTYNKKEDCYKVWSSFACPPHDLLLTNPPYSDDHIEKLMQHLCPTPSEKEGEKPWMLLMPQYVHKHKYFEALVGKRRPFFLVPKKRYVYLPPVGFRGKKVSGTQKKSSPFVSMWFVWGGSREKTEKLCKWFEKNEACKGVLELARSKSALRDSRRK